MSILSFFNTVLGQSILRFLLGIFGTICFFVITTTGFIKTDIDNPQKNPNLYKPLVICFFCIVGGILPLLFDIRSYLGCFVQGLTIKPILTYLYWGARNGKNKK